MGTSKTSVKPTIGICFLSFGINIFAGIEHALYNLCNGFNDNDIDVHIYSGYLSGDEDKIGNISIYRSFLLPSKLPKGDKTVRSILSLNKTAINEEILEFIKSKKITHAYICDPLWGIVQTTEAWKNIDIPMILSFHVLNTKDLLLEATTVPYHLYTTVSDYLRTQIQTQAKFRNIQVIPNSVEISRYRKEITPAPSNSPIIFCNARISPEKGIIYLVNCFPEILKIFSKAELWLCGGKYPFGNQDSYFFKIQKAITDHGITKNVRIMPKLKWDEIPNYIHQATLVVMPSLQETFGIAALEAMACGKPLVVTNVGNLPSLTKNASIIVKPNSSASLRDGILKVLQNEELYDALSKKGSTLVQKYSNKTVAQKFVKLIKTV
ncbi:MAG: glycosyl transferase family protein [Candidatus Magnetoglobus multicellularis str. Araruama]|uniref:Glycosyl transferase family protein n=1 Tax=Candidatus Magnetoglobus multicellularis str. Araruama TaxID=890399 RepID=A0A1V1P5Z9_9BACT|nr:MAG: glycosyl transferase family protein [Candidatus Magnetoglobus multicellularis str. Araruama]